MRLPQSQAEPVPQYFKTTANYGPVTTLIFLCMHLIFLVNRCMYNTGVCLLLCLGSIVYYEEEKKVRFGFLSLVEGEVSICGQIVFASFGSLAWLAKDQRERENE